MASNGQPGNVTGTTAHLFGFILTNSGGDVENWVEYGTTTAYGSETTHIMSLAQANQSRSVFAELSGLQRSTTYHYRFCARDSQQSGGPGCAQDATFTTANLECGDVVTHDFTLSRSMFCGSFTTPGLVVGADGIDINLGGRSFSGPRQLFQGSFTPIGIDNTAGHDDVTIRNGSLDRWGVSIYLDGASFNTIRNMGMAPTSAGVRIEGGESNSIRLSDLVGEAWGLFANRSDGLVVADSTGAIWSARGNGARIVRNVLRRGPDFSTCLSVSGNGNRIASNTVAGCPEGSLEIGSGANTEIVGNEVFGAYLGFPETGDPDGIHIGAFTAGTLLQGNFVHNNGDDGIDVRGTGTRLQDNRAEDNVDFGIDAVAGVTDLGGNTATGNGNALQCRNVFCQ